MNKRGKIFLSMAIALCLMLSSASCAGKTPAAGGEPSGTASSPSSGAVGDFPFSLKTDNDATVTFTHVPKRVLAANVNAGEQLMALGLGDKIIATSYNNEEVAEQFRKEYESKPSLTTDNQPSLEVVLKLNPDFIYGRSSAFGKKGIADHDTLTKNGIMSLSSIEGYKLGADVGDVYQDYENLGRIFQVQDRADKVVGEMKTRISAVQKKLEGAKPVKVFDFDMEMEGGAYTPGNNFTSKLIRRAGGVNVFENLDKTWNTVSWEAVVQADPDVIIINDYGETPLAEKIRQLKTNPALSGLKAVRDEKFISVKLPELFAGARVADTVEKFAAAFHPDRFPKKG
ncbi:ABC transporter substrate-binding protein [Ruminococcaceae bacterium BL-6]|jgi:iron complex transport system substrate-binding protein|nr:ABC transporter substrate-binding protein [Ruminococcaceae bacterium BL-6]HBC26232.1 ABC transporter substrate-binding protein [Oscillospiraceae bacterium]